jgi:hypothetical protein
MGANWDVTRKVIMLGPPYADDSRMSAFTCHNSEESCGLHGLHNKCLPSPTPSFTTIVLDCRIPLYYHHLPSGQNVTSGQFLYKSLLCCWWWYLVSETSVMPSWFNIMYLKMVSRWRWMGQRSSQQQNHQYSDACRTFIALSNIVHSLLRN